MKNLRLSEADVQTISAHVTQGDTSSIIKLIRRMLNEAYQNGITKGYANANDEWNKRRQKKW